MIDFKKQYALWDEFLGAWPLARLQAMTLDEYSKAEDKETFTYWLEFRLEALGSISGGSSFKFGVYSRRAAEAKTNNATRSYSDTHAWLSSLGSTAEEAFEKVRTFIVAVATASAEGDFDRVEELDDLGDAIKWKIAFLYQNRETPQILGIFTRAPLAAYLAGTAGQRMVDLQKAMLLQRPADTGILEFGHQVWSDWSRKNLVIWKLSHGTRQFSDQEIDKYLHANLAVMHGETLKGQGDQFLNVEIGTLFYLCNGNKNLLLVGQFTSDAIPGDDGDGWMQRSYRVLKKAVKTGSYQGASRGWTPKYTSTFKRVPQHQLPDFERDILKPFFDLDLGELASLEGDAPDPQAADNSAPGSQTSSPAIMKSEAKREPLNRIYYGPPGTGKTYTITKLLKADYEQAVEDIPAEARREQITAEKIAPLTWWEGLAAALYDLGGSAKVPELQGHRFIKAIVAKKGRQYNMHQTLWGTLQHHAVTDSKTVKSSRRYDPAVFDKSDDSTWHLAGEWKDACADLIEIVDEMKAGKQRETVAKRYAFVTFHQSYGYEEFVEGLRPVLRGDDEAGQVAYEIRPGAFKELCQLACQFPDQRFAMVIDEINRGNISKIFGELITLIERDKRDPLDGTPPPVEITLAYSGEKFSVPVNVDIIGTMNTADRSLALLDTALRRRFEFEALMPDTRPVKDPSDTHSAPLAGLNVESGSSVIDVRRMLEVINQRIEMLYDRDHCIGHAYFTRLSGIPDASSRFAELKRIFRNQIIPLLEEYFFEDWQKIRLVLGDNQKAEKALEFIAEDAAHEQSLADLFGNDHGFDFFGTKRRHVLQESAFDDPRSYTSIYGVR